MGRLGLDPRAMLVASHGEIAVGQYSTQIRDAVFRWGDDDGDGLADQWEEFGYDIDGDGRVEIDFPTLGATPDYRDIFVEVDAMVGLGPAPGALEDVVAAFANSPLDNPNGRKGIRLHALLDQTDITVANYPNGMDDFDLDKGISFGTDAERRSGNWPMIKAAKLRTFRYCIFANTYDGDSSSGLGETNGNDFMVTLGDPAWRQGVLNRDYTLRDLQSGTFMHELGHTLGLEHGGDEGVNYKPNYGSVMNYLWQIPDRHFRGTSWRLDYSREAWPTLDETDLDEPAGIGGEFRTTVIRELRPPEPRLRQTLVPESGPCDFNGNGRDTDPTVAVDINGDGVLSILRGFNDWGSIVFLGTGGNWADGVGERRLPTDELDFNDYARLTRFGPRRSAIYWR